MYIIGDICINRTGDTEVAQNLISQAKNAGAEMNNPEFKFKVNNVPMNKFGKPTDKPIVI